MTNKMAARVLTYELGSPSYGNSKLKLEKYKEDDRFAIFKPGLWRTGFFGCGEEWYHFWQQLMVSKRYLNFLASRIISFAMAL